MLKEYLQLRTLSLVILGKFNPSIIQPYWLAKKGLIKEQEAAGAKLSIVHPEITRFDLEWFYIEVTPERFVINCTQEPYFNPVKDLMEGIFALLPETPLSAVGLNHLLHFSIPTIDQYYNLGNQLTPFKNWNNILEDPRMLEFNIIEQKRKDGLKGHYSIRILPSEQVPKYGVLVVINDHLTLEENENERENLLINRTAKIWEKSFGKGLFVTSTLWDNLNK